MKPLLFILVYWFAFAASAEELKGGDNPFGTTVAPQLFRVSSTAFAEVGDDFVGRTIFREKIQEASFSINSTTQAVATMGGERAMTSGQINVSAALDTSTSIVTGSVLFDFESETLSQESELLVAAEGDARFEFDFEIVDVSSVLTVNGMLTTVSVGEVGQADSSFTLYRSPLIEILSPTAHAEEGSSQTVPVSVSMTLEPGFYRLEIRSEGDLDVSGPSARAMAKADLTFSIVPLGALPQVFWATNDGDYNVSENWMPQRVPGTDDTAIFDRDADYTVTFTDELTGRAIIERGEVVFDGLTYTLSDGTEDDGSLVVGSSAADIATLFLQLSTLNTKHSIIGAEPNTDGAVLSSDVGWDNDGRLSVGKAGIGEVSIENSALLLTGELRIGDKSSGIGKVEIRNTNLLEPDSNRSLEALSTAIGLEGRGSLHVNNSAVKTGVTEIGSLSGSMGEASLTGTPATIAGWVADSLTVGKAGKGNLKILDGNSMRVEGDITMGTEVSAETEVMINGHSASADPSALVTFNGTMTVGGSGTAQVIIKGGAICGAREVVLGVSPVGDVGGGVIVSGKSESGEPSLFTVFGDRFQIGQTGTTPLQFTGIVVVEEGAEVVCTNAFLGRDGGRGVVGVEEDSKFMASGAFIASRADATVDPPQPLTTARIVNHGLIQAVSITLEVGTVAVGSGIFQAISTIDYAGATEPTPPEASSKGSAQFATMTFDGDFNMERGEFILDIGGASEAMTDRIAIIGDANITGGTVTFNFVDGYLPQMGEMIPFLDVSGNTTFENVQVEYTGAAEGFKYNLIEMDGMVMLEALNDAQPVGGEPTPLPTALNPAADVNGDNLIDANDLLEVMRNWYHVVAE